ncbi:hypothetical protein, partial [Pseudomonas aeruginosa]
MPDLRERNDAGAPATRSRSRRRAADRRRTGAGSRRTRSVLVSVVSGLAAAVSVFALVSGGVVTGGQSAAAATSSAVTV